MQAYTHNAHSPGPLSMRRVDDGTPVTIDKLLGEGGQGEVYRADHAGASHAAKVYYPHTATSEQREGIARLVRKPLKSKHFLWPSTLIEATDSSARFGYLMPLREPRFASFNDVVACRVNLSFYAALTAAVNLADAFLDLHSAGLAYRDINLGNVFVDPTNGDIAICDTDNVGIDGANCGGVLGTSGFMAPEIERGEAMPSAATDRHSLAVLLFFLLVRHHPLEGSRVYHCKCLDVPARRSFYGEHPIYIFDATNAQNRPAPEQKNPGLYRGIYPKGLWGTFQRAFTEGLGNPDRRVTESAWKKVLLAARDLLMKCSCGVARFAEPGTSTACWRCHQVPKAQVFLKISGGIAGTSLIAVSSGKAVEARHLGLPASAAAVGLFNTHPQNPALAGLRNDTQTAWSLTRVDGQSTQPVPPGKSVPCVPGTTIQFGKATGVFE